MTDAIDTTTFTYTQIGQLASETGPWASDTISYTYNDRLRWTLSLQQPNGSAWLQNYGYDTANRLQSITSPAGRFQYAYNGGLSGTDSSGLVGGISLPNGCFITNTFDENARMLGTWLYNSTGASLDSSVYTNNQGNQRISVLRNSENYANYTYDKIGEVTGDIAYEEGGITRQSEGLEYSFDPAGNLASRKNDALAPYNMTQTFRVNAVNELTNNTSTGTLLIMGTTTSTASAVTVNGTTAVLYGDATFAVNDFPLTTTSFTAIANDAYGRWSTNTVNVNLSTDITFQYDGNGNLTNDGLRNFVYDDENELIQVSVSNQWMSQFSYDAKMRRRIRKEFTWQGSWVQTNLVQYVYDGNLVVQERDINDLPTVTYTRGKDLSGSIESGLPRESASDLSPGAGGIGGLLARTSQQYADGPLAGHAFYHSDGNGNITMLVDSSQGIVAKYLYDAFGNTLSAAGLLANANVYRFSSKEWHQNSGLAYYLYRYYDPNLQRWPNRDPIGERGGVDLYEFVLNNSISGVDFYGHQEVAECLMPNPVMPTEPLVIPVPLTPQSPTAGPTQVPRPVYFRPPGPPGPPRKPTCPNGGGNDPDCQKEWDQARQRCAEELSKPSPSSCYKPLSAGPFWNVDDCARGLVSAACGGNLY